MASPQAETLIKHDIRISRALRLVGWAVTIFVFISCATLAFIYALIGDTTPFGEAITTVPPVVWLAPMALVALPALLARSLYAVAWIVGGVFLLLICEDWQSLLRPQSAMEQKTGVRVLTWNIAGHSDWTNVLNDLETWQPDIVYLQETPDEEASLTTTSLTGYWDNFTWWDQGDCGILCRFPMKTIVTEKIGPWDKPALAHAEIALKDGRSSVTALLCSVRLMMPVNVTAPGLVPDVSGFRMRVEQYVMLAKLLSRKQRELETNSIILGGDFNVRGGSRSLAKLESAGLSDVWQASGTGWGGTILADFPVARIDQIWVTDPWKPLRSRTAVGAVSDHRMLICEVAWRN